MNQYMVIRFWYEEVGDLENGPRLAERHEYVESFPTRQEADEFVASRPLDTLFVEDGLKQINDFEVWMSQQ
jgi:hypothetical protein